MRDTTKRALDAARVEKDVENAYRAEVSYHKRLMHRVLPEQERTWHWPAGRVSEEKKYDAR